MTRSTSLDLETYSAVDLRAAGLHNYATGETGIHCNSYGTTADNIATWKEGERFPEDLREHIERGYEVTAWNAAFELALWEHVGVKRYGWPTLKPEQVRCSMAAAYAMAIPGALANAAPALGVDQCKDTKAARVMMQLATPKADGSFWRYEDSPEKFETLYEYNRQDVRTELAVLQRLMRLSDYEQRVWLLDQRINNRGVRVDLNAIGMAIKLVEAEKARLNAEMLRVTGGVVGACTEVQLLVKWIRTQGGEMPKLAKADVLDALAGDLPPAVRAALHLRKEAAKSSTAKLIAMENRASSGSRVRGIHQYHGAATGRWAGRGIQLQNYPRGRVGMKPEHIEDVIANLHDRCYVDVMYGPVLDAVADSLRGMIVPSPGHDLVAVDFANIEGRVLAWLAGEEWKLQAFREYDAGIGPDLYILTYARAFDIDHRELNKKDPRRQVGKVQDLSFGFQGGLGAWRMMSRAYPGTPHLDDEQVHAAKNGWREAHPNIVKYWYDLQDAAFAALEDDYTHLAGAPGRQVRFKKSGSFLWCKLPSGRVLCYPYPKIADKETPWGEIRPAIHFMSVNGTTNKWEETTTYGGSLAENVTQAVARDLLADALLRMDAVGYDIIGHIHDECIVEIEAKSCGNALGSIEHLMAQAPAWASGLPIAAEGFRAKRYRK